MGQHRKARDLMRQMKHARHSGTKPSHSWPRSLGLLRQERVSRDAPVPLTRPCCARRSDPPPRIRVIRNPSILSPEGITGGI